MGVALMIEDEILNQNDAVCDTWLSELLRGYANLNSGQDRLVGRLQLSSQKVIQGDVFMAVPGMVTDGRDYINQAIENRASAVIYEQHGTDRHDELIQNTLIIGIENLKDKLGIIASRYYGEPSKAMRVIGITGTNGKTTTAYLIAQAMQCLGVKCGYSGTVGYGSINNLQVADLTTTDAISMQRQFSQFKTDQANVVAMEVSSHGLDQGRANGVEFDIAVFTNLTQDHLDYHGSMARYAESKRRLFEFDSLKTAVINADDNFGKDLIRFYENRNGAPNLITYGMAVGDLTPVGFEADDTGIKFQLTYQGVTKNIESKLLGLINVPNILATIGSLLGLGYHLEQIAKIIPKLSPPPGRMEVFRNKSTQPVVVVDYAHTPDALRRALESLRPLCRGKLIVVFGCGGDRDQGKRPQMGGIADNLADWVILTNDNPRTEPEANIIKQIQSGLTRPATVIYDRVQAVREAIVSADAKDIILVAGKGHEQTQAFDTEVIGLSDRVFVPELLDELS